MTYSAAELQMVERHIAQGERHVVLQEELISRLIQRGLPTRQAELFLMDFQKALQQHRQHHAEMLEAIEREARGRPI